MNKPLIWIGAAFVLILGLWFGFTRSSGTADLIGGAHPQTFSSKDMQISFDYPDTYKTEVHEAMVELFDKDFVAPSNGEGPISITIQAFPNMKGIYTVDSFIKSSDYSNYRLGSKMLSPRTVGGYEGQAYSWTGLYEGKSVVVATPGFIYMLSVTWSEPTDTIIGDFETLLGTVRFGTL